MHLYNQANMIITEYTGHFIIMGVLEKLLINVITHRGLLLYNTFILAEAFRHIIQRELQ